MEDTNPLGALVRRRYRLLLVAILVLAAALRLAVYLDQSGNDPEFRLPALDSRIFLAWAGRIAAGDLLGDRPFFLNPLYPYFLAPILRVFGDGVLAATRAIQALLGLATVLLVADATRRLLGRRAAVVAGLLTALCPLLPYYEQLVMIVPLAVFLNAMLLWLLARFAASRSIRAALLAGLALGLSALARPNVGLFGVLLPLWFLTLAPEGASRIRFAAGRTLVVLAGTLLVVLPVTARNLLVGGDLVFVTSSGGVNLYQSNSRAARESGLMTSDELRGHPVLIENDAHLIAERAEGRTLRPSEVSRYWTRRALADMAAAPGAALAFMGRKLLLFLSGYELPSSYHFEAQRREIRTLGLDPFSFVVIGPLSLVGLALVAAGRRGGIPHLLLWVAYAVGLSIFFPLGHYRAPVLPAAIPLAAIGLLGLLDALAAGGARLRLLAAGGLLVAVAVSNVPPLARALGSEAWPGPERTEVVFHYNRGIHAVRRGDLDFAREEFRRARERGPDSPLPDQGMADLALARGDVAAERRHLEAALARRPDDPPTLARLGLALVKLGKREAGIGQAERAARLAPRDWVVFSSLAEIYLRLGRYRDALRAYDHAVTVCGLPETEVLAEQSRCLRALGDPAEALRRLGRGLVAAPGNGRLHLERALALIQLGSPDAASIRAEIGAARSAGVAIPPGAEAWLREHR